MNLKPKEIVILSGKGGTGKTSLTASLATFIEKQVVLVDCDTDAANLHLLLKPKIQKQTPFIAGKLAKINPLKCNLCGLCIENCSFDAIQLKEVSEQKIIEIDPFACEGCGVCTHFCPHRAIEFTEQRCGISMFSSTKYGPMFHAHLDIGGENSGKLVALLKKEARDFAQKENFKYILVDGPPGLGCPVIASLSGSSFVLIITEPTCSGLHDFERILKLVRHFKLACGLIINKWDLNPKIASQIEEIAFKEKCNFFGLLPYSPDFTKAQIKGTPVVKISKYLSNMLEEIWLKIEKSLN